MDYKSLKFERRIESSDKFPTWSELSDFLEYAFRTLEAIKLKDGVHSKGITSVKSFATELKSQDICFKGKKIVS